VVYGNTDSRRCYHHFGVNFCLHSHDNLECQEPPDTKNIHCLLNSIACSSKRYYVPLYTTGKALKTNTNTICTFNYLQQEIKTYRLIYKLNVPCSLLHILINCSCESIMAFINLKWHPFHRRTSIRKYTGSSYILSMYKWFLRKTMTIMSLLFSYSFVKNSHFLWQCNFTYSYHWARGGEGYRIWMRWTVLRIENRSSRL